MLPILNPPPSPYHPSGSSQCTSPKHPASCIEPGLATRLIHDITRFNAILPNLPTLSLWLLELDNFFFLINLIVNWLCRGTFPTPKCLSWYVDYFKLKTTKAPKNLQEASLTVSLTAYKNSSASSWNRAITTASASRVGWCDGEAQQDPRIWVHCVPWSLPGPWNIYQNICFSLPM